MPSITSSDRQAIISLCKIHDETQMGKSDFRRCVVFKSYFIKYGSHGSLYFQCETQKYIHSMTVNDPSAPRVPKVVDYFTPEQQMAYLVMEFIDATTPPDTDNAYEKVADALRWLRGVFPPPGITIGSVGGGPARHELFRDFEAPLLFSSKRALQNYKALEWIPARCRPTEMSFSDDELVFTQSDMDKSNFFIDKDGKMCIFDFEDIVLLPESFASYTMNASNNPFVEKVAGYLKWSPSPNEHSMTRAGGILNMISDTTLDTRTRPCALEYRFGTSAPAYDRILTTDLEEADDLPVFFSMIAIVRAFVLPIEELRKLAECKRP